MGEMQKVQKPKIKFATDDQVKKLRQVAKKTRNPTRNELIILMLYQHGLRETELCNLKMTDLNLNETRLFVRRIKNGNDFIHPIPGEELRLIRKYLRNRSEKGFENFPWLFISEQGGKLHRDSINKLLITSSKKAGIERITPHMLRHGCGYKLINQGVDIRLIQNYLGHKDIRNTVIYTQLDGSQFEGLWE